MKAVQERAKIVSNKKIGKDYFKLTLSSRHIASFALPGQFVEIKVSDTFEPLLRRPLGVHETKGNSFSVLCEIVGCGTRLLSDKQAGSFVEVIGPLGHGFDLSQYAIRNTQYILIAGGMGVAPLLFLAEKLVHSPQSTVHRKPLVIIGAKAKSHILCVNEFRDLGCEVKVATDDGSMGFKGRVTELLKVILRRTPYAVRNTLYTCGPKPMLKEIARIAKEQNIPAEVSLEAHMSCGIGACLGCMVKTKNGPARVCKEGPVFDTNEILWQEMV